jgi:hypothetical protein
MWTGFIWLGTVSRNFYHLASLRKHQAGKQLAADAKVTYRLQKLDIDFFYASLQTLVPKWDKCLYINGECVEI